MTYLILQMLFCLLIAFLLGALVGWLLCKLCCCTGKSKQACCDKNDSNIIGAAAITPLVSDNDTVIDLDTAVDLDGDGYGIETLEGIGPQTGDLFRGYGVATVGDFLRKLHNPVSREQAAKDLNIMVDPINKWASMADLLRIDGVDHQFSELLTAANIRTIFDLSKSDPQNLAAHLEEVNNAGKQLIAPTSPSAEQTQDWVSKARNIADVVTF